MQVVAPFSFSEMKSGFKGMKFSFKEHEVQF